jgi:hypothetical protein
LNVESARAATREAGKKAFEQGYDILFDVTGATLRASITEAYQFPRDVGSAYEDSRHRNARMAILYRSVRDEEFWEFYETTAMNTGLAVKVTRDWDDAVAWLSSRTASP